MQSMYPSNLLAAVLSYPLFLDRVRLSPGVVSPRMELQARLRVQAQESQENHRSWLSGAAVHRHLPEQCCIT